MVFYFLFITLAKLFDIMGVLMLIRALLSWVVPPGSENRFVAVLDTMTEFVVAPVRSFMERFDFVHRIPLDVSFFIAFLLVQMLSGVCSGVAYLFL